MQTYTSRPFELKKDINTIFGMISSPAKLALVVEKYADKLKSANLKISEDEITFDVPMMGNVQLKRTEILAPNRVKYETVKSPVPFSLILSLAEHEGGHTLGTIAVEANIPSFLSGTVKGKIEPALEKLADLLEMVDFDRRLGGGSAS